MPVRLLRLLCLCALPFLAACATTEGTADDAGFPGYGSDDAGGGLLSLARTDERVRTVQLHRSADETSLPLISLQSGETLTLSFDLLDEGTGRPLSVYFYHTDRSWRRDLLPSEALTSFLSDDIRDYQPSAATQVRYVHYEYEFPNANIGFAVSGNFVVRVAEQGREDEVLLERAFFMSEDAAETDMGFRTGFSGGAPVVQLRPGPGLASAQPFDYAVCFARNGQFDRVRCAPEPDLLTLALLQFYLPHTNAFQGGRPYYEVDLGPLQPGPQVAAVDYSTTPISVALDLDYARFGSEATVAGLTGQPVIEAAYRGGGRADTDADYVEVLFRYVPEDEQEAAAPVFLTGAFNAWQLDPALALTWDPATLRYEGTLLLKQGLYLYQYVVDDPTAEPPVSLLQPALYTALVYLRDPARFTDRLVAYRNALAP